jgi:protein tyrosine/serine phosphatase
VNRHLDWDGCFNTRDLGGLPTAGGGATATGAVVRTDAVDRLTGKGWSALWEYGVRTVVDLRNADEYRVDAAPRPPGLTTLTLPLAPDPDSVLVNLWSTGKQGTPLYYPRILEHFPRHTARVVRAVALAAPGGVVVHCVAGRDRTGLASLVLLALAGVPAADIAADYELSTDRLPGLYAALGEPDRRAELEARHRRAGTTTRAAVLAAVASFDPVAHLRAGGLSEAEIDAARTRLTTGSRLMAHLAG